MGLFKDELIKSMLNRKADENNSIDLNAYESGLSDMFDKISESRKVNIDSKGIKHIIKRKGISINSKWDAQDPF